ncbi:hypothetical protein JCM14036_08130 [Desulfotomaculum defluvii]
MNSECTEDSLKEDLDIICKDMPAELLDREGYLRLSAITSLLPFELSNFWILECLLNRDEPLSDVSFEISNNTLGQKILAGDSPSCLDDLCLNHNVWKELRAFTRQWAQESNILNKHIRNLWLEFDTECLATHEFAKNLIGNPSIFLGFRSNELSNSERAEILHRSSDLLHIPDFLIEDILSFMNNIPSTGQLFQLGSMLGRPSRDTRVCVNQLHPEVIPFWLSEIGWSGDNLALSEFLNRLTPLLRDFAIDLNLTKDGPSRKIGIECYMDWDNDSPGKLEVLLDFIQEFIWCSPNKRKGLLQYSGSVPLPAIRKKAPDGALYSALFKRINHIKLVLDGRRITDAKVYLAIYRPSLLFFNNWFIIQ